VGSFFTYSNQGFDSRDGEEIVSFITTFQPNGSTIRIGTLGASTHHFGGTLHPVGTGVAQGATIATAFLRPFTVSKTGTVTASAMLDDVIDPGDYSLVDLPSDSTPASGSATAVTNADIPASGRWDGINLTADMQALVDDGSWTTAKFLRSAILNTTGSATNHVNVRSNDENDGDQVILEIVIGSGPAVGVTIGGGIQGNGSTFDFGFTTIGILVDRTLVITNQGDTDLTVSIAALDDSTHFDENSSAPYVITAGSTSQFLVSLRATVTGTHSTFITLTNDSDVTSYVINLTGLVKLFASLEVQDDETNVLADNNLPAEGMGSYGVGDMITKTGRIYARDNVATFKSIRMRDGRFPLPFIYLPMDSAPPTDVSPNNHVLTLSNSVELVEYAGLQNGGIENLEGPAYAAAPRITLARTWDSYPVDEASFCKTGIFKLAINELPAITEPFPGPGDYTHANMHGGMAPWGDSSSLRIERGPHAQNSSPTTAGGNLLFSINPNGPQVDIINLSVPLSTFDVDTEYRFLCEYKKPVANDGSITAYWRKAGDSSWSSQTEHLDNANWIVENSRDSVLAMFMDSSDDTAAPGEAINPWRGGFNEWATYLLYDTSLTATLLDILADDAGYSIYLSHGLTLSFAESDTTPIADIEDHVLAKDDYITYTITGTVVAGMTESLTIEVAWDGDAAYSGNYAINQTNFSMGTSFPWLLVE